jgi:hypothetical protein
MSKTTSGLVDVIYKSIYPDYTTEGNGVFLTKFLRKILKLPTVP